MTKRPECCGKPMQKHDIAQSGRQRWRCGKCRTSTTDNQGYVSGYNLETAAKYHEDIKRQIGAGTAKRFVITCAQNNTKEHANHLKSLETYCEWNNAILIVIPVHHKNISLYTGNQEYKKEWSKKVSKYIIDQPLYLGGNVVVRPDIKIAATAFNPLSGMEPINGNRWTIFGHPQCAMQPVASPNGVTPKRMYTTGAVTVKNYSQTKAGAKAEFHHTMGALVVEVIGKKKAFIRQVSTKKGPFYDLDGYYTPDGAYDAGRALALTPGDEHVKFNKKEVRRATYDNPDSIVNELQPKYIFRHDVLDGYAGSHHHLLDDVTLFRKFHNLDSDYRSELDQVVDFINETTPANAETCIVPSNHHDHLYKWLAKVDPKKDHQNAILIHELKKAQYDNALAGKTTDPLEIYLTPRLKCKFRFLDRNEPFIKKSVDYSQHGDVGTNGSKGSAVGMAKTTYKMVIGHSHGSRIVRGVTQVGTSTGKLEYENGLGDHTNTHALQYADGRVTLLDIIDGDYRGRF